MFDSADNVLKLSPEKVYVVCVSICVCVCGNCPNWTRQNTIIEPLFSQFSFQRLMAVKIKTNNKTPRWRKNDKELKMLTNVLFRNVKLLCSHAGEKKGKPLPKPHLGFSKMLRAVLEGGQQSCNPTNLGI